MCVLFSFVFLVTSPIFPGRSVLSSVITEALSYLLMASCNSSFSTKVKEFWISSDKSPFLQRKYKGVSALL